MKIRWGFISNSSSSSFVLDKSNMTQEQIKRFRILIAICQDESGDTYLNESDKHFYGTLSNYNIKVRVFLKENNLDADFGD